MEWFWLIMEPFYYYSIHKVIGILLKGHVEDGDVDKHATAARELGEETAFLK